MKTILLVIITFSIVQFLGAQALNFYDQSDTILMTDATSVKLKDIKFAMQIGGDVNEPNKYGYTPLMRAVAYNRDTEITRFLLDAGANVNYNSMHGGSTALISAAMINTNPEVINLLLKAGANINAQNNAGETPLIGAAINSQNSQIIILLLNAGANYKLKDNKGRTAWDWIQYNKELKNTDAYKALKKVQANQ